MERGEFEQIINTGEGHWHVVLTIGMQHRNVNVFDSMYCHCLEHSKVQIANVLMTNKNTIQLYYKCSHVRKTGLFAIAFVTALLNGLHPGAYNLDHSLMRSHLLNIIIVLRGESGNVSNY